MKDGFQVEENTSDDGMVVTVLWVRFESSSQRTNYKVIIKYCNRTKDHVAGFRPKNKEVAWLDYADLELPVVQWMK